MKLQGTWVGLGGIGLFIQTRLTQILLERNSGDTVESTFKNLLSFLLRSYWQGDKKTKLPDAWDVSSIFRLLYTRCILFHLSAHAGIGVTRFEQRQAATPAHRLLLCLAAALSELGCPEEDPRGWNRCSQPPSSEAAGPCAPAPHWRPLIVRPRPAPRSRPLLTSASSFGAPDADGVSRVLTRQWLLVYPTHFSFNQGFWSHPEFSKEGTLMRAISGMRLASGAFGQEHSLSF